MTKSPRRRPNLSTHSPRSSDAAPGANKTCGQARRGRAKLSAACHAARSHARQDTQHAASVAFHARAPHNRLRLGVAPCAGTHDGTTPQTSKRTVAPAAMAVPATPKRPGAAYVSALSLSRVRFSPDMGSSSNRSLWAPGFIAVTCSAPPLGGRDARGDAAIGAARGCYQGHGWGPMRVSGSCYPTITPESNSHDAANKGAAGRPRILLFASGVWIDIASSQSCHNFSPADTYHQAAVCSYVQTCAFKTPFARPAFHFPYADG